MTPQEIANEAITKAEKKVFDLKRMKAGVDSSLQKAEAELTRLKGGVKPAPVPFLGSWEEIQRQTQAETPKGKPALP